MTHRVASPDLKLAQQIGFVKLKPAGKDEWSFIATTPVILVESQENAEILEEF